MSERLQALSASIEVHDSTFHALHCLYILYISPFVTKMLNGSNTHNVKSSHGVGTVLALDDGLLVRAVPVVKLRVELDGDDLQVTRVVVPGEVTVHTDDVHVRSLWARRPATRDVFIVAVVGDGSCSRPSEPLIVERQQTNQSLRSQRDTDHRATV